MEVIPRVQVRNHEVRMVRIHQRLSKSAIATTPGNVAPVVRIQSFSARRSVDPGFSGPRIHVPRIRIRRTHQRCSTQAVLAWRQGGENHSHSRSLRLRHHVGQRCLYRRCRLAVCHSATPLPPADPRPSIAATRSASSAAPRRHSPTPARTARIRIRRRGRRPMVPLRRVRAKCRRRIVPAPPAPRPPIATSRSVTASIAGADLQSGDRMSIDPKYVTIATTFGCPSTSTPIGRSHSVHG